MATPCRVLIVEQSANISRHAGPLFSGKVVQAGPPVDYASALDAVLRLTPQLVLLDLEGHAAEAILAVELLMARCPTPVLVLAAAGSKPDSIRALAAGALDVMEKPSKPTADFWRGLNAQVTLLAGVSVVRHVSGSRRHKPAARPPFPLVAIGASLGGPKALIKLLQDLPKGFATPIVICQHITVGFADDLARWLKSETRREVLEATRAGPLTPNTIYVAGSDAHLLVKPDFTLAVEQTEPVGGFRPSCDVLLRSVAACFGEHAIGVILTGMGRDGARGLKEIRSRGGHTIAQDERSSVVFGMPGEAIALGAAEKVLPLDQIAAQLARWT